MKTNNYINNKAKNLFFITALIITPLLGSAQIDLISGGKVGIGITPNSGYKLHVYTPNDNNQALLLERAGDANATLGFKSSLGLTAIDGGGSNGRLTFYTAGSEKVRITPDGKVGIGITNPSTKFHVNGNTTLTGNGNTFIFITDNPGTEIGTSTDRVAFIIVL